MNQIPNAVIAPLASLGVNGSNQLFLVSIRPIRHENELKYQATSQEETPKGQMTVKQRRLVVQLISRHFFDRKERDAELLKIEGFDKADADAYIKNLISR
ncbi:MAG: hypothetical protein PHW33_04105 [Candidatus Portnoybacteria bacterium]|nr:hypothetical protein [Candidatus Portnoybacteria bacterium]MDD5438002.1 hypothetical protein [Patescibacteria group bacterium]